MSERTSMTPLKISKAISATGLIASKSSPKISISFGTMSENNVSAAPRISSAASSPKITPIIAIKTSPAAVKIDGRTVSTRTGIASEMTGARCSITVAMPPSAVSIFGRRFPITPPLPSVPSPTIVFTRLSIADSKSASSLAMLVTRFSHADFIDPIEPCTVLPASCAVVPVMPISVCTMWMASVISAKLSMDKSAISPLAFLTLFASLIRRSISFLVPP